jgi:toxin HigB-1
MRAECCTAAEVRAGVWSVAVSGNWRATFKFEDGDVVVVNYFDYR